MDNNHGFAKNYYKKCTNKKCHTALFAHISLWLNFTFSRCLGKIFLIFQKLLRMPIAWALDQQLSDLSSDTEYQLAPTG